MKPALICFTVLCTSLWSCSSSTENKKYTHIITDEKESLQGMSDDSAYTLYYCWADWCGPCISSMKSTLAKTKKATDSLGIPIKYNAILYSLSVKESITPMITKAYDAGIDVYHTGSAIALTQKLEISSDFESYEGFEKRFAVPRVLLVDESGKVIDNNFMLYYDHEYFIPRMKKLFPEYIND